MSSHSTVRNTVEIKHFARPPGFEGWSNFVAFGSDYLNQLFTNYEFVAVDPKNFTLNALGVPGLKADVTAKYTVATDGSVSYLIKKMTLSFEGVVFEKWSNLSWSSAEIEAATSFDHFINQFSFRFTIPKGTEKDSFIMGSHVDDYIVDERSGPRTKTSIFTYGGDDQIDISNIEGSSYIGAGPGNDTVFGGKGKDFIDGETDDDRIFGGDGRDNLKGGEGNDRLFGGGSADRMDGEKGDDLLRGGEGNDFMGDNSGANTLYGGNGDDQLFGVGAMYGGVGNDDLSGRGELYGGIGNDTLNGRGKLSGGGGDDVITGEGKPIDGIISQYFGGTGDDQISVGFRGYAEIWGGAGHDILNLGDAKGLIYGGAGNDTITGQGELYGGAGNDQITGQGKLYGGAGNDEITGKGELYGGSGTNKITGTGKATISAGGGNDVIKASDGSIINTGAGKDIILSASRSDINVGGGNDVIKFAEGSTINAGAGNDVIKFASGSTINTGAGNDIINSSLGSTIDAGGGNDIIRTTGGGTIDAGAGDDFIRTSGGTTIKGGLGNDSMKGDFWKADIFDFTFNGKSGFGNDKLLDNFDDCPTCKSDTLLFNKGTEISFSYQAKREILIVTASHAGNIDGTITLKGVDESAADTWIAEITAAIDFV